MSTRKVIVTIAPTGGFVTPDLQPYVPTQPDQIADEVHRCVDAGASVAALHARRPDHAATCDPDIYRRINDLVRARCDVVINNSTGGGVGGDMVRHGEDGADVLDWTERLRGLDGGAEICTFDAVTTYASTPHGEVLMDTRPSRVLQLAALMREKGIKPEWEVFNPSHIVRELAQLTAAGFDSAPYVVNLVLGMHATFQNAMPYTPRVLQQTVDLLPAGSVFTATVCGPDQMPGLTHALLLGGHVRVGLEDTPYDRAGAPERNVAQVERIVRIIEELGMEPATPAEARQILGLISR
ncbi:3-keto-5-aminohexanoate cleavage protein [Dactylosporangium sucinum]|uniref:3-keto-5-aminohexanoate cleavage protein n=1 Tax=Dactylosporangium sucinum TaxID=1424081 RepID=A0A917TS93_9ACTN|nr:3-keto-5-aminohexanoate cleavage protein [Dactylosporangium sucinum]GGM35714.1 3-keto-5-aminohexanoate cleavage protein [Dactylosporangium sucinum]